MENLIETSSGGISRHFRNAGKERQCSCHQCILAFCVVGKIGHLFVLLKDSESDYLERCDYNPSYVDVGRTCQCFSPEEATGVLTFQGLCC